VVKAKFGWFIIEYRTKVGLITSRFFLLLLLPSPSHFLSPCPEDSSEMTSHCCLILCSLVSQTAEDGSRFSVIISSEFQAIPCAFICIHLF
jgi:hypothetical protein